MSATGWIFDIQHFSTHDGPGIRTLVFLQGCPLRCRWCHNPEGWTQGKKLAYTSSTCIGCGRCAQVCSAHAHLLDGSNHFIDRNACTACGACVDVCPAKSLEIVGRRMRVEEVMSEVAKDLPFYQDSGGGMTLTGGEPLQQSGFSLRLLQAAKECGINTCIETCGFGTINDLLALAELTDLFLFDIKHTDERLHQAHTGVSNRPILRNLAALCRSGAKIRLRLPWIPGVNDTDAHIDGVAEFFNENSGIESVELVPYHALGVSKIGRIGDAVGIESFRAPEEKEVESVKAALKARGVNIHGFVEHEA